MSLNLKIFVVFHNIIYNELYDNLNAQQKAYLSFYGVKDRQLIDGIEILYENELPIYEPIWQKLWYNESTALYHIYKNRIHEKYDFVGFLHYDMILGQDFFTVIEETCNERTIFYYEYYDAAVHHEFGTCLPDALQDYNEFFDTNFSLDTFKAYNVPINNTFIIHKHMFEKLMNWLSRCYVDNLEFIQFMKTKPNMNVSGVMEAYTGAFLCLQVAQGTAEFKRISIQHDEGLKLQQKNKGFHYL